MARHALLAGSSHISGNNDTAAQLVVHWRLLTQVCGDIHVVVTGSVVLFSPDDQLSSHIQPLTLFPVLCSTGTTSSAHRQLNLHATAHLHASTRAEPCLCSSECCTKLLPRFNATPCATPHAAAHVQLSLPSAAVWQVPPEPCTVSAAAANHAAAAADAADASLSWAASIGPSPSRTHELVWVRLE